jgi:TPR repeat protein
MTRDGIGTKPDAEVAFELYQRAAEGRHARAQVALAILYAEGDGSPPSEERALYWAYRAYKNGVEKAVKTMDDMSEVLAQEAAKAIMAEAETAEEK